MRLIRDLVLVLVSGLLLAASAAAQETTLTGTITLHGCVARASDFNLQVAPTTTVDPSRDYDRGANGGGSATALISARSANGREFEFRFSRLAARQPYLLDLRFVGRGCEKVFWSGLTPGRVIAGGAPVEIHGYAARTRIEVLGESVGRPARNWVGADHLDFTDPIAGVRKLRVQTDLPGVTRVTVQVATEPYPTGGRHGRDACEADDDTVIRSLEFVLPSALEFGVDPRRGWEELPAINFNELLLGGPPIGDGATGPDGPSPGTDLAPLPPGTLSMLNAGAPLYVRAIAMSDDGSGTPRRRCNTDEDGVAGWVKLVKLAAQALIPDPPPPPPLDLRLYSAVYKGPTIQPWPGPNHQYCVRAVQDHPIGTASILVFLNDPFAWDFVTAKNSKWGLGGTIKIGDGICYAKSSSGGSSIIDVATGLVTGAIDGVGMLVDSASRLWESVKQAVVNIVADVINAVGLPPPLVCASQCKALLMAGVNIAMASAGIPPTLPNVAALKQDAIEYVAAQVADQSPVPGTGILAEHALEYAVATAERYAKKGDGGGLPEWLTMDLGLVPATMTVQFERVPTDHFAFRPRSSVYIGKSSVYESQFVELPRRFWTSGFPIPGAPDLLKVPVVLQPNLSKVPPLDVPEWFKNDYWTGSWNKQHWAAGLAANPCATFPFVWWVYDPIVPFLKHPVGTLGFLGAPTFSTVNFNPPLPVPAVLSGCK